MCVEASNLQGWLSMLQSAHTCAIPIPGVGKPRLPLGPRRQIDADSLNLTAKNSNRTSQSKARHVRLRTHAEDFPTQGKKDPLFLRKSFFDSHGDKYLTAARCGPSTPPAPTQDLGHSRSRIVIEPASVPEAAAK